MCFLIHSFFDIFFKGQKLYTAVLRIMNNNADFPSITLIVWVLCDFVNMLCLCLHSSR